MFVSDLVIYVFAKNIISVLICFVQKAYKRLFNEKSMADAGTLYYFKILLKRTDVNGNVKSAFQSHEDFLLLVGKAMLVEQFLEFSKLDSIDSPLREGSDECNLVSLPSEQRRIAVTVYLKRFLNHYHVGEYPLRGSYSTMDDMYNYACQLCH